VTVTTDDFEQQRSIALWLSSLHWNCISTVNVT